MSCSVRGVASFLMVRRVSDLECTAPNLVVRRISPFYVPLGGGTAQSFLFGMRSDPRSDPLSFPLFSSVVFIFLFPDDISWIFARS